MTRQDLLDYLLVHHCEIFPLSEFGRANCVGIKNPATKTTAFLDTPIDGRAVRAATVCQICFKLGIQIPDCAKIAEGIIEHIDNQMNAKPRR